VEIGSEKHGNVTQKYANAQTMILQDFPTKVPCTRQYPPKWKIEGKWYCSLTVVRECNEAPTQINLTYDHTFRSMKAIFDGIRGGILTATQLQGSRLWRQLAQCQEPVAHALAYSALYNSPNRVILSQPLDQTTMQGVAYVSSMMITPLFAPIRLDMVLPGRNVRDLQDDELRPQRDVEDVWAVEREGLWVVADRRPLGCHVQSPPPSYYSDEEHHEFQPGASRKSSPDESYRWASAWCGQQQDPVSTRRNYRIQARRNKKAQLRRDVQGK
jgi:hypothetical protein